MTIKELRLQKKMTQQQLADAIGVNVSVISKYENGSVTPPKKRLELISYALDTDLGTLLIDTYTSDYETNRADYIQSLSRVTRYENYLERIIKLGANGKCELCKQAAPFTDKYGRPYLEVHVIDPDSLVRDIIQNTVALCPNCHQKLKVLNDPKDIEELKEIASKHNY